MRQVAPLFETTSQAPQSAKDLNIAKISRDTFVKLNMQWHSKLPLVNNCFEGICFGAEFDGMIYAVAWWSKPIAQNRFKDGQSLYELRRMAIADDAPKFTATRMLSKMIKVIKRTMPNIKKLISYQDTSVHNGTIYKAGNWQRCAETKFISWKNRKNRIDQSEAIKIRWEYEL